MATTYKGIEIPTSARDLELFSSKKGAGAAAQDILRLMSRDDLKRVVGGKWYGGWKS